MKETLLQINRGGLPAFSARGCRQILRPLKTGELRRTVNGELCYLGRPAHHKYGSEIHCHDQQAPAFESFWRGEKITVSCLQRLCQEIEGDGEKTTFSLGRPSIPGSERVVDTRGQEVLLANAENQTVSFSTAPKQGTRLFISYRPHLEMRVTSFTLDTDEWGAKVGWHLILEEI